MEEKRPERAALPLGMITATHTHTQAHLGTGLSTRPMSLSSKFPPPIDPYIRALSQQTLLKKYPFSPHLHFYTPNRRVHNTKIFYFTEDAI